MKKKLRLANVNHSFALLVSFGWLVGPAQAQVNDVVELLPYKAQLGDWQVMATATNGVVDNLIAIHAGQIDDNTIPVLLFQPEQNHISKSFAEGLNKIEALEAIKSLLNIPDSDDCHWPVLIPTEYTPRNLVKKEMGRGVAKFDPMQPLLVSLNPQEAKVALEDLEDIGWMAADIPLYSAPCDEDSILAQISFEISNMNSAQASVHEFSADYLLESCVVVDGSDQEYSLELINVGDYPREHPNGAKYACVGDRPVFTGLAFDASGSQVSVDLQVKWSGGDWEPYIAGTPIPHSGYHYFKAQTISESDSEYEQVVKKRIIALPYRFVSVDSVVTRLSISQNMDGSHNFKAWVELRSNDISLHEVNMASLDLWVTNGEFDLDDPRRHTKIPLDEFQDAQGDFTGVTQKCAIDPDGTMHAVFEGSVPGDMNLGFVVTGRGLGYPNTFGFDCQSVVMLGQEDGDDWDDWEDDGLYPGDLPEWDDGHAEGVYGCAWYMRPGGHPADDEARGRHSWGFDNLPSSGIPWSLEEDSWSQCPDSQGTVSHAGWSGSLTSASAFVTSFGTALHAFDGFSNRSYDPNAIREGQTRGKTGEEWALFFYCSEYCVPLVDANIKIEWDVVAEARHCGSDMWTQGARAAALGSIQAIFLTETEVRNVQAAVSGGSSPTVNLSWPPSVGVPVEWDTGGSRDTDAIPHPNIYYPPKILHTGIWYPIQFDVVSYLDVYANGVCHWASPTLSSFLPWAPHPTSPGPCNRWYKRAYASASSSGPEYSFQFRMNLECEYPDGVVISSFGE